MWFCSHGNCGRTALRACSSSVLEEVSSLRLVVLLSSDHPWHGTPRDPVAVEPSPCPRTLQDLAESEPLETDVAFVSNAATRASKLLTLFNVRVFASYEATVWESVWTQCSNQDIIYMGSGNSKICLNISLILSSIVLARYPVPPRSGREPLGEPYPKRMRTRQKLQKWVIHTWTRQKQKGS